MVGQSVLRECLRSDEVTAVVAVGRTATGDSHPKLREIVTPDVSDLSDVTAKLTGFDACLFCLGVSAAGKTEAEYRRVTYDLTVSVARTLASLNPNITFVYVSGSGTDSSERGRMMWARVKGATENALLAMPIQAYMLRPGFIQPMHGVRSKTGWYRAAYAVSRPLYPVLRRLFPHQVSSSEQVGRAMIRLALHGAPRRVLEGADINALAAA